MISANPSIDTFIETSPAYLRDAICYCATPYWFQEPLAVKIIENFVKADYSAQDTFYRLLDLPFIYSHDETTWQYTDDARKKILASLVTEENKSKFKAVHTLVANEIKSQLKALVDNGHADLPEGDQQSGFNSWQVRRLRWQLIYHLAPVDPEQAYKEFQIIAEWAIRKSDRLPMYKLAVDAWEKQAKWLNTYKEEGAYYQGYFAYKMNDFARAENLFSLVWLGGTKNMFMKADAGHLLGVIYRQKGQTKWNEEAEKILRASLAVLENKDITDNKELIQIKARILNSLGATLVQTSAFVELAKAQKKLEEAEILLSESLRIEKDLLEDSYGSTHVLNTFSTLYLQYEVRLSLGKVNLNRAKEFIDAAIDLSQEGSEQDEMIHFNTKAEVLIQLGDENNLKEAEELLFRCLEINKKLRDERTKAISCSKLGKVYIKRGDENSLRSSITWLYRGLETWKGLENSMGQKECMELIATAYEQLNEPEKASSWRRSAYLIS